MTLPTTSPHDRPTIPWPGGRPGGRWSGHGEDMRYLEVPGVGLASRVGLGTWQFGSREWGYGDDYAQRSAHDIVRRALELGVTFFDTAEVYAFGRSERILSEALGADRQDVVVATKLLPIAPFPPIVRGRAHASATRLRLPRIPLYQVHQPNPLVRDSVTMRGMAALLDEGRIGAVGVSNYSLDRWREADAALGRPVVSNQVQFSLASPGPLEDLVPFAEREDRVVIAYSPLAQGLLGGGYGLDHRPRGVRAANPLFGTENLRRVEPLLATLREVADAHDATAGSGRPRLAARPAAGRRHPGRLERRAARVQRGRGRPRPGVRRAAGPHRGCPRLLAGVGGSQRRRHRPRAPATLSRGAWGSAPHRGGSRADLGSGTSAPRSTI